MFAAASTQRLAPNDRELENLTDLDAARSRLGLFLSARRKQGCNDVLVERRDNKQGWGELAGKCVCTAATVANCTSRTLTVGLTIATALRMPNGWKRTLKRKTRLLLLFILDQS